MPVLLVTGARDWVVPPGMWEATSYTRSRALGSTLWTGSTSIMRSWGNGNSCNFKDKAEKFMDGYDHTDCRTYCS